MAINSNHLSEELNGIKCAIVEKNASANRVAFLKPLLEINGLTVVVVPSPPAKATAPPITDEVPVMVEVPETFTVGVTNQLFNPINAVYGRLLKSADAHIVTLAYWHQREPVSNDQEPYYTKH